MRFFPLLFLLGLLYGCASSSSNATAPVDGTSKLEAPSKEEITVEGSFITLQGVRNELSCYCFSTGILTTESGESYDVCFDGMTEDVGCTELKITGVQEIKEVEGSSDHPCPAGERILLQVTAYECK